MTKLLTLEDLAEHWDCSKQTARQKTLLPGFPPPVPLGPRTLRWRPEDLTEWEARPVLVVKRRPRPAYVPGSALPMPRRAA